MSTAVESQMASWRKILRTVNERGEDFTMIMILSSRTSKVIIGDSAASTTSAWRSAEVNPESEVNSTLGVFLLDASELDLKQTVKCGK